VLVIPASASFSETALTGDGKANEGGRVDISDRYAVWSSYKYGNLDIFIYNLPTKVVSRTTNASDQNSPAVYGDRVVWVDSLNGGSDIYLQNMTSKVQTRVITNGGSEFPDIYGDYIAYFKYSGTNEKDIYLYNIKTKASTKVEGSIRSDADLLRVYKNKLIWWMSTNDETNSGVYIYDITTETKTKIIHNAYNPNIYENSIVFDRQTSEYTNDIFMYNITSGKTTQLTTNSDDQRRPIIYGNSVIWLDDRNTGGQIYAYDLKTKQQIHTASGNNEWTAIFGSKVAAIRYNGDSGRDVYLLTVNYNPVASFTYTQKATRTIQFNDRSIDMYYWTWNFGDGKTSTIQSPSHQYAKAGTYTVKLTVRNAAGSSSLTKSIKVK
jgi:beta propeller repeat protein